MAYWLNPSLILDLVPTLLTISTSGSTWTKLNSWPPTPIYSCFSVLYINKAYCYSPKCTHTHTHTNQVPHLLHINCIYLSSWISLRYILSLHPYGDLSLDPHHFLPRPLDSSSNLQPTKWVTSSWVGREILTISEAMDQLQQPKIQSGIRSHYSFHVTPSIGA